MGIELREAQVPVTVGGPITVNRAFYRMVYCGSHNRVLIQYRDAVSARTERYAIAARQASTVPADVRRSLHEDLLAALEARDPDAAEVIMCAHYEDLDLNFADLISGAVAAD